LTLFCEFRRNEKNEVVRNEEEVKERKLKALFADDFYFQVDIKSSEYELQNELIALNFFKLLRKLAFSEELQNAI